MTALKCFFEPIKGEGWERRDELGNTAPYRKHPHLGCDWGFKNGSRGKDILAIHAGVITAITNNPALGWSVIVRIECADNCPYVGEHIEYNHMVDRPNLKIGQKVTGGNFAVGKIGSTGTALSAAGADHLHASMAKNPVPSTQGLAAKRDLFKLIDASKVTRKAIKDALAAD
jgi:hypothetical protein